MKKLSVVFFLSIMIIIAISSYVQSGFRSTDGSYNVGDTKSISQYSDNLDTALDSISTSDTELIINKTITMGESETVPATCKIVFTKDGLLNLGAYDLTINSPFECGRQYIFNAPNSGVNTGDVSFGDSSVIAVYPEWFGSAGDDVVLQDVIDSLDDDEVTLWFGNDTWAIDADLTFNAATKLKFEKGAILDIDHATVTFGGDVEVGGKTFDIDGNSTIIFSGNLEAGLYQIFDVDANSTVTLNKNKIRYVHPAWTGVTDDDTDKLSELNKAEEIASDSNIPLWITGKISIDGMFGSRVSIYSNGGEIASLDANTSVAGTVSDIWDYQGGNETITNGITFSGLKVTGNLSTRGFRISGDRAKVINCEVYECAIAGIGAYEADYVIFDNNYIHDIRYPASIGAADGIYTAGGKNVTISNNRVTNFRRDGIVSEDSGAIKSYNTKAINNKVWNANNSNDYAGTYNGGIWFENTNGGQILGNDVWDMAGNPNQDNPPRGIIIGKGASEDCTFIITDNLIDMFDAETPNTSCTPLSFTGQDGYVSVIAENNEIRNTFQYGVLVSRGLKNVVLKNIEIDNYINSSSTGALIHVEVEENYGNPSSIIIDAITHGTITLTGDAAGLFSHLCFFAFDSTSVNTKLVSISNVNDFSIQSRETSPYIDKLIISNSSIKYGGSTAYGGLEANNIILNNVIVEEWENRTGDDYFFRPKDGVTSTIITANNCFFKGLVQALTECTAQFTGCAFIDNSIDIIDSGYSWTVGGGGTNEYYVRTAANADPKLRRPWTIYEDGVALTASTADSLSAGEWAWGDSDTLGYSTIYVRLTDGNTPDPDNFTGTLTSQVGSYFNYSADGESNVMFNNCFIKNYRSTTGGFFYGNGANEANSRVFFRGCTFQHDLSDIIPIQKSSYEIGQLLIHDCSYDANSIDNFSSVESAADNFNY